MSLPTLMALVMFVSLVAYAVLAGADFGAGVWDLLAYGKRRAAHRAALAHAIGPVWEANHVWLIFVVVLLFTCFPAAYAQASVALFWPLHAVLLGIVLRGAAFVFRAYAAGSETTRNAWGSVFGASSAVTPILLGMCLGALSTGDPYRWYDPFPVATGVLALLICAYLAAVYLAWETDDAQLRIDFRRRALAIWWLAGVASIAVLFLTRSEASRLWTGLTTSPGDPVHRRRLGAGADLVRHAAGRPARSRPLRLRRADRGAARGVGGGAVAVPDLSGSDGRERGGTGIHAEPDGVDAARSAWARCSRRCGSCFASSSRERLSRSCATSSNRRRSAIGRGTSVAGTGRRSGAKTRESRRR